MNPLHPEYFRPRELPCYLPCTWNPRVCGFKRTAESVNGELTHWNALTNCIDLESKKWMFILRLRVS